MTSTGSSKSREKRNRIEGQAGRNRPNRRDFLKVTGATVAGAGLGTGAGPGAGRLSAASYLRVPGAGDRLTLGVIGLRRGGSILRQLLQIEERDGSARVAAVCDVYERRRRMGEESSGAKGYLRHEEILERNDIDAVVVATPDHSHAHIAIEAMEKGKDVYLEKPMTHTIEEAQEVCRVMERTGRIVQVGSQTTSSDQWWKAREAIERGLIGKLIMTQGSYHRNSLRGEWNYDIDPGAGPDARGDDFIDWKQWLAPLPERPWDPERFFRFRKFWDYSGGIATDLFYHVVAPLQICWGETQFPHRVTAGGGIYVFKDREVPDTFMLTADYPNGHSLVLSSSMANHDHIPGLIRGHEGTITIVPDGRFEGRVEYITVTPQRTVREEFASRHGTEEFRIACEPRESHLENFLRCVRTREKPVLDAVTGYKAQVVITMSVMAYRQNKVLFWDEEAERVVDSDPRAGDSA